MPKLTITRGLPGSGKTTWAREWVAEDPANRVRVNRDAMRKMLHFDQRNATHLTEQIITKACADLVRGYLRTGQDVVVDDTNLRQRNARAWATLAHVTGSDFEVKDFTGVPLDTCLERNQQRPAETRVPEKALRTMHAKFLAAGPLLEPTADAQAAEEWEPWHPTPGLPDAYLVDIDGTVALCGDRDIYDGAKAHLDTVNENVANVIGKLSHGHPMIYMSGRSEEYREVTEGWLHDHGLLADHLHMRPAGDKRKDSTVKHELFNKHVRGNYNVAGVFDDRNQVVDMWRAIGLTVFQVADGNF